MKFYLIIVFLICSISGYSQDEELDHIPISYYILTRTLILEGKVLDIKDKKTTVEIKTIFKGESKSKNLTLRTPQNIGLELNESYIFLLARKEIKRDYLLFYPYQRMKVRNDSLFISENNLTGIQENSAIRLHQPNTFGDSLSKAGYKISVKDFSTLVTEINETFEYYNSGNSGHIRYRNNYVCYDKLKEITKASSPFNLALLKELNGFWEKKKCDQQVLN